MLRSLVLLSLAACATTPRSDAVDALLGRVIREHHVPGVAVAVVRDGRVERSTGLGLASVEWSTRVTSDTRFQIASTTKIFTGTLVLLLAQEGKLSLDAPLSTYLPDLPASWSGITVRHLTAHAAGIAEPPGLGAAPAAEAVRELAKAPLAFPPGTRTAYENADFIVLTHLLEVLGGQPFPALLRARIFAPLGFTCTTFEDAVEQGPTRVADIIPSRAGVYRFEKGTQRAAWFLYPSRTYASGGAFSCLDDLARWAVAMDRGQLLSPATEALALAPWQGSGFSVAFTTSELRGLPAYGHSGGPALADVVRIPSRKLTVIVLTNQQRLFPNLAPLVAGLLLPAAPLPAAVPDDDPGLTARLRRVIDGYGAGRFDDAEFASADLPEVLRVWGPLQLGVLPPVDALVYLGGDRQRRSYATRHGAHATVHWRFQLDAAGKISDIELSFH